MATISINGEKMAQGMYDLFGFLNSDNAGPTYKYEDEVFLIEYSNSNVEPSAYIHIDELVQAIRLNGVAGIELEWEDENTNGGWIKRPKPFGIERKFRWYRVADSCGLANPVKKVVETIGGVEHTFYPNPFYQIAYYPNDAIKSTHIGFFRVVKVSADKFRYHFLMSLEMQSGTVDSKYGNLYHLKHLTFTFS